jgi:alpha-glucosidase
MMKRLIYFLFMLLPLSASAQQEYNVKLENDLRMNIQVCQDGIFRVRISPRKAFADNLMIRYGLQKTDWGKTACQTEDNKSAFKVTTAKYVLTVNKKEGTLSVTDKQGKTVISKVNFLQGSDPLCTSLGKSINEAFANLKVIKNDGIIGDDKNSKERKDTVETGNYAHCSIIRFALREGERFYGGGSTSREHIQHRGELLRMWVTYQHTEIPQPFMMSSNGWGVFNNTTLKNFFDVGRFQHDAFSIFNTSDEADFYLMVGDDMPAILNDYTLITGRAYLQPKYAYGMCFGPNMLENQFDILRDAADLRTANIPCDVLWLEPQWMEKRYDFSTKKKWNYKLFSPEGYWDSCHYPKKEFFRLFIGRLHGMGYKLGLWLCENYDLSLPEEDAIAKREGLKESGQEHWMDHLKPFIDQGVNGFKLDPARTIDEHPTMKYYNGYTDRTMHNLNQILLPKQIEEMMREHTGKRNWHHYCGGYAGTQHWGAATSGDNGGGEVALFDQLNLGMSGFMNISCDVMGVDKPELEMPAIHFGIFLPWMQINSWFSMMSPIYYSKKNKQMYGDYIRLRYSLMPYLYSAAIEGSQTGMPMVRCMPLEFPEDRNVDDNCHQYLFGKSLLVGIFSDTIYLPKGEWIDFWTGERLQGGSTIQHKIPDNRAGLLFLRQGAIIPMQQPMNFVGENPIDTLTLKVFPKGKSAYTLLEDDGTSYDYEKGAIAATKFTCEESNGGVNFEVLPVKGQYKGMYAERAYLMEFYLPRKPKNVQINGRNITTFTYSNDGILRFSLPRKSVKEKTEVLIR